MIDTETARQLRDAGLRWQPEPGDRFVVLDRGIDREVFMLSEMTVEVHGIGDRRVFGFNGTTEWALDSIEQDDVVWLPHEGQLRSSLGAAFRRLEPVGDGWAVTTADGGRHVDVDAERAYARAVLATL